MSKSKRRQRATEVPEEDILTLRVLYVQERLCGRQLSRDELPYSQQFDDMLTDYNALSLTHLSCWEFWRQIGRILKTVATTAKAHSRLEQRDPEAAKRPPKLGKRTSRPR